MDDDETGEIMAAEEAAETAATAPEEPGPLEAALGAWFAQWYPETPPTTHPVSYLSGAWHHARAAFDDLKTRLAAPRE